MVSEVTLRILQKPATQRALLVGFDDTGSAGTAVGNVIAARIIPAGMEMMDGLAINAVEDFANAGYPRVLPHRSLSSWMDRRRRLMR